MMNFNEIIREYFDLSDNNTRRYIATLEDAGQEQLLNALSSALYNNIVNKVDDIDFGTIPASRGDITKVQGFDKTEQCIDIMRRLVIEYKQNPSIIDVVITAISNIKDRKAQFIRAYGMNVEVPMLIYNLIVLSIERSVSLMIATCIQYVKDPSSSTPKMALDKVSYLKTMDDVLYNQLITFNNLCANKTIDNIIDGSFKTSVREDVEQYGVAAPIDEEPEGEVLPSVDNDGDLFGGNSEVYKSEEEPKVDENPADEVKEIPATTDMDNFPEVHYDDNDQPIPVDAEVKPVEFEKKDEEDLDIEITDNENQPAAQEVEPAVEEPTTDNVEVNNIPQVNPTDDITDSNTAINEEPTNEGAVEVVKTIAKIVGLAGIAVATVKVGKAVGLGFIKLLRNAVYGLYYSRMKMSDYLEVQAELIEANANELEYSSTSGLDDNQKKKVVEKQRKWAARLREWSNKFNLDSKESSKNTEKAIKEDEKNKKKIGKDEDGDDALF